VKQNSSPNIHLCSEIVRRWQQLSSYEVEECGANRSKLIEVLQSRYGFARRRAEKEVDLFYEEFEDRLRMAA
jgi:hypothetical protein